MYEYNPKQMEKYEKSEKRWGIAIFIVCVLIITMIITNL